ncbi:MAG: hypothetical protein IKC59_02260, partial [Clostridia bacterium]|nr:hypothetical protein [Clostridia bacterium]
ERVRRITELQAEIRKHVLEEQVGKTVEVLFETHRNGISFGHTPSFIEISCPSPAPLHAQLRRVRITAANEQGCLGELI